MEPLTHPLAVCRARLCWEARVEAAGPGGWEAERWGRLRQTRGEKREARGQLDWGRKIQEARCRGPLERDSRETPGEPWRRSGVQGQVCTWGPLEQRLSPRQSCPGGTAGPVG